MVRTTYKYLKPVALFFAIVFLFQCCKVFYKEPTTIDQAIESDIKRVKVITKDDRKHVFDSIYYKDAKLYGLLVIKGENQEILIRQESIKEIHLYNYGKSATMSVLLVLGIPIAIIGISYIAWAAQGYPLN